MRHSLLLGIFLACHVLGLAQGSFTPEVFPVLTLPVPDHAAAIAADDRAGRVPRFALPVAEGLNTNDVGTWTAWKGGGYLWRLALHAPEATSLIITTRQLPLPNGAWIILRDGAGEAIEFQRAQDVRGPTRFTFGPIKGEYVYLEYFTPDTPATIQFDRIYYGFRDTEPVRDEAEPMMGLGFGASQACNVNINCVADPDIQAAKRGVVRMMMVFQEGVSWCTGSLINNVRQDRTPYILSAFHCQYGYTPLYDLWAYHFDYEAPGCDNPQDEPFFLKVTGSQMRAKWADSDMLLLEIEEDIPLSWAANFNAWDRSDNYLPANCFFIHHPSADIKKVSIDSQAIKLLNTPINWSNGIVTPPYHHVRLFLDLGTSEPGSSGGPLFDPLGRIIGQLNGGSATCTTSTLNYGRLQRSWTGGGTPETRVRDWLDPDNTGANALGNLQDIAPELSISGQIRTAGNKPVPNVTVTLSGPNGPSTTSTDASGNYIFTGLPVGGAYEVTAARDGDDPLGVTIGDIVLVNKFLVGLDAFPTPYAELAADVNDTGNISVGDMLVLRKLLLSYFTAFPDVPSWKFVRVNDPYFNMSWEIPNLSDDVIGLDFIGVKYGDVNHSVNP